MPDNKKDAFYFSHDSNARHDIKMAKLRRNLGAEGYGIYWMLIESLREQSEYNLLLISIPDLAYEYHISEDKLSAVINDYDLFEISDGAFHSRRLMRSMDEYNTRKSKLSEAGKKGNEKRWDRSAIATPSPGDANPIALKKRKGNKEKERKIDTVSSEDETGNVKTIVEYLNQKSSKNHSPKTKQTISNIKARLKDGYKLIDFYTVIDTKTAQWLNDPDMVKYLNPETLFGNKFDKYLNEKPRQTQEILNQKPMSSDAYDEYMGNPLKKIQNTQHNGA